jgi:carbonic anhydrase
VAQGGAAWDYTGKRGPLAWGKLDPAYKACSQGKEQSPIDLRGAKLDKSLQPIEVHYRAGQVTLVNDGHTILVQVDPGSYIVAGGVRYELKQISFHHPSEHPVKGKLVDMDVQLLHQSADGKMAMVSTRYVEDRGDANAVLATLWQHLPEKAGATEKVADEVNPAGLLPQDRGYMTYVGSLSTPPCTEGVRWFVMENEMSVSRSQLRSFELIFKMNSRPLQDPHGRRVTGNE